MSPHGPRLETGHGNGGQLRQQELSKYCQSGWLVGNSRARKTFTGATVEGIHRMSLTLPAGLEYGRNRVSSSHRLLKAGSSPAASNFL